MAKRVCVVGAGVAGLSAAKNLLAAGIVPVVLERTSNIGGLWVYSDCVGTDEYGLPVHSSMYQNLWTNLPKEVMELPGLKYDPKLNSFMPASEVIKYINEYAKKFDLRKHIWLEHYVENIKPRGIVWDVQYKNLRTGKVSVDEFDYVMICAGHYSVPSYPSIEGFHLFKGHALHSHDYKSPEKFANKTVCLQGAGPSGLDLVWDISKVCKKLLFSHHVKQPIVTKFPSNVELKPDILRFDETKVTFVDGSEEEVDVMLFCTGYLYEYPFLDSSCQITIDNNHVQPLYKHLVNIEYPTMCIIGIPFWVNSIPMFDLQVRYFVEVVKGNLRLPSREEMHEHSKAYFDALWKRGVRKRHAHVMGVNQQEYYDSLSDEAKIKPMPVVLSKIFQDAEETIFIDLRLLRRQNYTLLDDENFERKEVAPEDYKGK